MTDWKLQQMIKASGWPLAAEHLAPGADFNARLGGGLVPLHWACAAGKAGVVQHMLDHGANVLDAALRERLAKTFGERHTDAKNRLLQALRDWDQRAKRSDKPLGKNG